MTSPASYADEPAALPGWRFSVAPMMDWTDRHCRAFHRALSGRARLYTEMVTTGAVIHGDRERLLGFSEVEHPVAVQLGGSNPADLAESARIAEGFGYGEINLNVGCPSDRVQEGRFGACLMREPALVGACVAAMKGAVRVPVTVKCRIGVDDQDPEAALDALAEAVVAAGVDGLVVHARKAWLKGLSPKENRDVPPLDYGRAARLKQARPSLPLAVNGGLRTIAEVQARLAEVDGAMVGRAAYMEPALLLRVDPDLYGVPAPAPDPFAGFGGVRALRGGRAAIGRAPSRRDAPHARPVQRAARRPRLPPPPLDARDAARGGPRHPARGHRAVSRDRATRGKPPSASIQRRRQPCLQGARARRMNGVSASLPSAPGS